MSGHSHWKTIKHKKGEADAKKSAAFSKMAREITIAAKQGGIDLVFNAKLRLAIEKAKGVNMPADNIERAIKKGSSDLGGGATLEEVMFEAYGPGGVAVMIEGITDNKNRALNEIKQILNQNGGKLVGEGGVKWMFERKGVISINAQFLISNAQFKTKEEMELAAIEAGADDIRWHEDGFLDIYTKPEELEKIKKGLEEKGLKIDSFSLEWVAKEEAEVKPEEKESCYKLFDLLDESDSVQEIYSNLKERQ